ncbi:MAG: TRAP transporter substrate-binding protein DctP [Aminobacterium sp.]|uniref:TRAP transporter substrate-binding protein DctP n=1 Tax=unclassified Aminobacterium TaxID=2685012 RepID=UPI0027DE5CC1|nr:MULTISPECIES: TRAP transporter substrate-binding protein DctP [unclassified Aminobacterium]MDD3425546.1 TRAP transporter substrate-binding protein DctP [Aminobacterium sp.]MEA4877964.1 TRAP transporter substrate-binding protein DctP [Aminobacterium sp.]WMI71605.1 TRAP transporter substrate-binding protein DctP [Aminobacterium sp. MB27-C1]
MKKFFAALLGISFVFAALSMVGGQAMAKEKSYTWKISHIRPADTAIDKDVKWFAEKLEQESNGRIKLQIFDNAQLGDYTVVHERVSVGAVEMAIQPVVTTADKMLQILNLPYIVSDWEGVKKNYVSGTPLMNWAAERYAKQDLKIISVWPVYFGGTALMKEPNKPGDPSVSKGLKVRVPTQKAFELLADAQGYMATPLAFAETFTALQTGIVDGAFGAGAEGYYANFRDIIKCYVPSNTHFEQWYLIMNMELWNSLSKEDQALISKLALEMENRRVAQAEADQAANEKRMEDYGINVIRLSGEELGVLTQNAREKVWPEMRKILGEKNFDEAVKLVLD